MKRADSLQLISNILIALALTSILVLPPATLGRLPPRNPAFVSPALTAPIHRTFYLRGDGIQGWNLTNPGPALSVVSADLVSLMLIGNDFAPHRWFIDFNNNFLLDSSQPPQNETATASLPFSSTTAFLNFTFTPTIGTNIPAAGNWTYRCSVHPFSMTGSIRVMPEQISAGVSSTLTLDSSRVTTSGTLTIDTRSLTASGSLLVNAVDSVSGLVTFTRTYTIPSLQMLRVSGSTIIRLGFLVNVPVMPYALSSDITLKLQDINASTALILSRQLDLDVNGVINIIDIGIAAAVYGTSTGNPKFNPQADFDANGVINIIDIGIIAAYYNNQAFR